MSCLKDMVYWHPKLLRYLPSPDSRRGETKTIGRSHHICPLSVNNLTHNYLSRVKERQREKKNDAFLLHFKHSTRAHSCPNPSITWLTDWMLKYRNTLQNRTNFNCVCGKPTCLCQNVQHQCSGKRLMVCFQIFTVYL